MNLNQIVIGTANFGSKYGIDKKKISFNEVKRIFNVMKYYGFNYIDTAKNYSGCESVLYKNKINKINIITKIGKVPSKINDIDKWIFFQINKSLKKLKIKKFYAILVHNSETMLGPNSDLLFNSLKRLKKLNKTKKIGCSVYDVPIAKKIINKYNFDIIQIPVNFLDRRFVKKSVISFFKKKKLEIHARSIFLQGALLKEFIHLPVYLKKWKKLWLKIENITKKNKITKYELCMSYIEKILKSGLIDKIIIGINDVKQLTQIIKYIDRKKKYVDLNIKNVRSSNALVDPRMWRNA